MERKCRGEISDVDGVKMEKDGSMVLQVPGHDPITLSPERVDSVTKQMMRLIFGDSASRRKSASTRYRTTSGLFRNGCGWRGIYAYLNAEGTLGLRDISNMEAGYDYEYLEEPDLHVLVHKNDVADFVKGLLQLTNHLCPNTEGTFGAGYRWRVESEDKLVITQPNTGDTIQYVPIYAPDAPDFAKAVKQLVQWYMGERF